MGRVLLDLTQGLDPIPGLEPEPVYCGRKKAAARASVIVELDRWRVCGDSFRTGQPEGPGFFGNRFCPPVPRGQGRRKMWAQS